MQRHIVGRLMSRRAFVGGVAALGASAGGLLLSTRASAPTRRLPRLGYLSAGPREARTDRVDGFLHGLRDLGYVEGETIAIEWRFTPQGAENEFDELANELVGLELDLIVIEGSTVAAQAAKRATTSTPLLGVNLSNPVQTGLVPNLANPGGNFTALASSLTGLPAKQLEILRSVVPGLQRVAVLVEAAAPSSVVISDQVQEAGRALNLDVQRVDLRYAEDLETAFETAMLAHQQAVFNAANTLLQPVRMQLAELAVRHRVASYGNRAYVEAGLLLGYGVDQSAVAVRAGAFVHKILSGTPAGDLPVEQPTVLEFVVNLRTAQALGLAIPREVAAQVTAWIN
jgi:putative tryptophan/tyrosine transport system substrate-binding protein